MFSYLAGTVLVWMLGFAPPDAFGKDDQSASSKTVEFDHASEKETASYHRSLKSGESFAIVINNTATNCFNYDLERVQREGFRAQRGLSIGEPQKTLTQVHEERYGGYIVHIKRVTENPPAKCGEVEAVKKLKDATVIIAVETVGVEVAFAGGFTFSGLTNPRFASRMNDAGMTEVIRDEDAEDTAALGVGAFIHTYGKSWPQWVPSPTFGIGINNGSIGVCTSLPATPYLVVG